MTARAALMRAVRALLAARGYVLAKREFAPFGQDPWIDVRRLSREWGRAIGTCLDVGANVGQTARRMLEEFPRAAVHCFEPHPATYAQLAAAVDGESRIRTWNLALGDAPGALELHEYGESQVASLVRDAPYAVHRRQAPLRAISVPVTTVDRFCGEQGIDRIGLLKVDAEGYDARVLKGTAGMLAAGRVDFVYVEFSSIRPRAGVTESALSDVDAMLDPAGYRFVATYTDKVSVDGRFFMSGNALYARIPAEPGA